MQAPKSSRAINALTVFFIIVTAYPFLIKSDAVNRFSGFYFYGILASLEGHDRAAYCGNDILAHSVLVGYNEITEAPEGVIKIGKLALVHSRIVGIGEFSRLRQLLAAKLRAKAYNVTLMGVSREESLDALLCFEKVLELLSFKL